MPKSPTTIMNATIVTSEYFDKTTNQKKKNYLTIGTLFIYDGGGMSLKLDAFPIHGQNINFYPRTKEHNQPPNNNNQHYNQNNQHNQNNNYQQ
jgi:hypothetical protein